MPHTTVSTYNGAYACVQVSISETRQSFLHFITNVCAIVGGVFTVAGIVDSILYHGDKLIRKKQEIGKYT